MRIIHTGSIVIIMQQNIYCGTIVYVVIHFALGWHSTNSGIARYIDSRAEMQNSSSNIGVPTISSKDYYSNALKSDAWISRLQSMRRT